MSNPYVGEIRIFAGNFAPNGWLFCQGQILQISEYDTLFNLIGTTYGGDGQNTFALPNLASRLPVHQGNLSGGSFYAAGQTGGVEQVTLTAQQLPVHTHQVAAASGSATLTAPAGAVWANAGVPGYATSAPGAAMAPAAVGPAGGSQAHDNVPPYLAVNFIISLYGIYPTPN